MQHGKTARGKFYKISTDAVVHRDATHSNSLWNRRAPEGSLGTFCHFFFLSGPQREPRQGFILLFRLIRHIAKADGAVNELPLLMPIRNIVDPPACVFIEGPDKIWLRGNIYRRQNENS